MLKSLVEAGGPLSEEHTATLQLWLENNWAKKELRVVNKVSNEEAHGRGEALSGQYGLCGGCHSQWNCLEAADKRDASLEDSCKTGSPSEEELCNSSDEQASQTLLSTINNMTERGWTGQFTQELNMERNVCQLLLNSEYRPATATLGAVACSVKSGWIPAIRCAGRQAFGQMLEIAEGDHRV